MSITKKDLYTNVYDYETLKTNIYAVCLFDILHTQRLTSDFCVKYILNKDFQLTDEEKGITIELVNKLQPHLSNAEFVSSYSKATNKKIHRKRSDSFEDFESFAKRSI